MAKTALILTLIVFGGFSTYALIDVGYFGIWEGGMLTSGSQQILFDLVVALGLFLTWMIRDAKARGVNPLPWVIGTLTMGSLVPLVYLILREHEKSKMANTAQLVR